MKADEKTYRGFLKDLAEVLKKHNAFFHTSYEEMEDTVYMYLDYEDNEIFEGDLIDHETITAMLRRIR